MNFIVIPKLYYTTRTTYWVGSPKDVLFSHTTPQGANHLSLHRTNRHRYHPIHQSVSSPCTPQRWRHGLHAQGRGFSCPQLLIFLQPWNLAWGASENTNSYSSLACVAGVIGEGEGERGSREKIPLNFCRLPRSPSPSSITPATQAFQVSLHLLHRLIIIQ